MVQYIVIYIKDDGTYKLDVWTDPAQIYTGKELAAFGCVREEVRGRGLSAPQAPWQAPPRHTSYAVDLLGVARSQPGEQSLPLYS